MVAQAIQEAEIRRIIVQGQVAQKVLETPPQSTAGHSGVHLSSQLAEKHR
jgi:hypothetical protein